MDSHAYLSRYGWKGKGHGLHGNDRGIKKPLLVSRKNNSFGIGKKQHQAQTDQWWARSFDASLKSLVFEPADTPDATPKVQASARPVVLPPGSGRASGLLYDGFVRGSRLEGTVGTIAHVTHSTTPFPASMPSDSSPNELQRSKKRATLIQQSDPSSLNRHAISSDVLSTPVIPSANDETTQVAAKTESKEARRQRKHEKREHKKALKEARASETTSKMEPHVDEGAKMLRRKKKRRKHSDNVETA